MDQVVLLQTPVNSYKWGKIGSNSLAAVIRNEQQEFTIDEEEHYAEMWMGSHVSAPSKLLQIKESGEDCFLDAWIKRNPVDILGRNVFDKFGADLPYLFKILSIRTALSIQAHPGKELAAKLHQERPDIYADPNHKPEMAIALTDFEGLCGFRPILETIGYLEGIPELQAVVGVDTYSDLKQASEVGGNESTRKALKAFMKRLLTCSPDVVAEQLSLLDSRVRNLVENNEDTTPYLGELFLRLHAQYPGDCGCFCIYVLNYISLQPSEAVFLKADFPHAYISGDLIECMACSNNVVRAGLTPKLKDVETLVHMLDYTPQTVAETKLQAVKEDEFTWLYDAPIEEFAVRKIQIPADKTEVYSLKPIKGPSILLTLNGQAELHSSTKNIIPMKKGVVLFICCDEAVVLRNITEDLLMFQAFCEF